MSLINSKFTYIFHSDYSKREINAVIASLLKARSSEGVQVFSGKIYENGFVLISPPAQKGSSRMAGLVTVHFLEDKISAMRVEFSEAQVALTVGVGIFNILVATIAPFIVPNIVEQTDKGMRTLNNLTVFWYVYVLFLAAMIVWFFWPKKNPDKYLFDFMVETLKVTKVERLS